MSEDIETTPQQDLLIFNFKKIYTKYFHMELVVRKILCKKLPKLWYTYDRYCNL